MKIKALLAAFVILAVMSAGAALARTDEPLAPVWRVTAIGGPEIREVPADINITAVFSEDGIVTGFAGCNNYSARFSTSDKNIKIGPPSVTRKCCNLPRGIMELEAAFLNALESVSSFRWAGERLEMLDANGKVAIVFTDSADQVMKRQPVGEWRVESLGKKTPLPGTSITMSFTEDGRLAGGATVNRYFASWIADSGLILISGGGTTMMAGPEAFMKQESEFLKMLGKVRKYEIRSGKLILTTSDGERITAVPDNIE